MDKNWTGKNILKEINKISLKIVEIPRPEEHQDHKIFIIFIELCYCVLDVIRKMCGYKIYILFFLALCVRFPADNFIKPASQQLPILNAFLGFTRITFQNFSGRT